MACHYYHEHYGVFPPAYVADENGRPMHSWRVLILPFLEEKKLYDAYDFSEPWDGPHNRELIPRMPRSLVFPGDETQPSGVTNYLAVVGPETVWRGGEGISMGEIADPARTIMIAENRGAAVRWTEPRDLPFASINLNLADDPPDGISSKFSRAGVACVDGSTWGLSKTVPPQTLRALLTVTETDNAEDEGIIEWPNGRDVRETPPAHDET